MNIPAVQSKAMSHWHAELLPVGYDSPRPWPVDESCQLSGRPVPESPTALPLKLKLSNEEQNSL